MPVMFAAGDPGGSRALLPVLGELEHMGQQCVVVDHGFLGQELPASSKAIVCTKKDASDKITNNSVFIFGSSVADTVPLSLARLAKQKRIPVIHVLDSWGTYRTRLCTDGFAMLVPDVYTALDETSRQDAVREGVPASCLVVTGHPGLAELAELAEYSKKGIGHPSLDMVKMHEIPSDKLCLAFINEPFEAAFGADAKMPNHPGFTERTVLAAFLSALAPFCKEIYVLILAHPKQKLEDVSTLWQSLRGDVSGHVLALPTGREVLRMASGIAGMASILLYESWLCGLPTLALQPDCSWESMRRYASLEGLLYTMHQPKISELVGTWLVRSRERKPPVARPELAIHQEAPRKIAELALRLCKRNI